MTAPFRVFTSSHFDRLAKALRKRHPQDFTAALRAAVAMLSTDPYNTARRHAITKLVDARPGEGQYRLRIARFRFRYDIEDDRVILVRCALRREDTYR
jgi:mRNA-degrading endonuclease RelE of RelBE toxin-antitoxin system